MSFFKKVQTLFAPQANSATKNSATMATTSVGPKISSVGTHAAPSGSQQKMEAQGGGIEGVRHIVAVGSGKGGVGKSTVTLNLALALQQLGLRVGVLDADIYGPSQQHLTRAPKPEMSGEDKLDPSMYEGLKIISVAMFTNVNQAQVLRGPMATQLLRQLLTQVNWGELDYLLIDLPPGTGDIHLSLAQMAPLTGAVLVTTPQEMSIIDVRKAVSMFNTLNVPMLGVVENMSYFICDNCDKKHYIFKKGGGSRLAAELGLPLLAEIPLDQRVVETSDEGKAVMVQMPNSDAAKAFVKSAKTINDALVLLQKSGGDGGLGYFLLEWK